MSSEDECATVLEEREREKEIYIHNVLHSGTLFILTCQAEVATVDPTSSLLAVPVRLFSKGCFLCCAICWLHNHANRRDCVEHLHSGFTFISCFKKFPIMVLPMKEGDVGTKIFTGKKLLYTPECGTAYR